jgi:hypothetical protein
MANRIIGMNGSMGAPAMLSTPRAPAPLSLPSSRHNADEVAWLSDLIARRRWPLR